MPVMFWEGRRFGSALDFVVSNYYLPESEEYRDRLVSPSNADLRDQLKTLAEQLFKGATRLASADAAPLLEAFGSVSALPGDSSGKSEYVMAHLDAELAEQLVTVAVTAEQRLLDLLFLVKRTGISKSGALFLRRVSRCFLFGFDVECAVMCRSALDAEFQAEISADDCGKLFPKRPAWGNGPPMFDLSDRITVAEKMGRIDAQSASIAHDLRKRTNPLLHRRPEEPSNVKELIESTLRIISRLAATGP